MVHDMQQKKKEDIDTWKVGMVNTTFYLVSPLYEI